MFLSHQSMIRKKKSLGLVISCSLLFSFTSSSVMHASFASSVLGKKPSVIRKISPAWKSVIVKTIFDGYEQEYKGDKFFSPLLIPVSKTTHLTEDIKEFQTRYKSMVPGDQEQGPSTEWDELLINALFTKLNKTHTTFGRTILYNLLKPITDVKELKKRQQKIKVFLEDESLFEKTDQLLTRLGESEDALLGYWNPEEEKYINGLFNRTNGYYWRISFLKKFLNKYRLGLEAGIGIEWVLTLRRLLGSCLLSGLEKEAWNWAKNPSHDYDLIEALTGGFKEVYENHDIFKGKVIKNSQTYRPNRQSFVDAMFNGTLKDRYLALLYGVTTKPLKLFGMTLPFTGETARKPSEVNLSQHGWAAVGAGGYTFIKDLLLYTDAKDAIARMQGLVKNMSDLRAYLSKIAQFVRVMNMFKKEMANVEGKFGKLFGRHLQVLSENVSGDMRKLMQQLSSGTFKPDSKSLLWQGKCLQVNALLQKVKDELIPFFRVVGEIDAYHSLARLYKDAQESQAPMCFVEFVDQEEPLMELKECWTPLIDPEKVVANNITLDLNGSKVVITGPNGGGKSTYLKSIGHALVLGQSWGLVPASRARMTIFDGLCTCLNPGEDITRDFSKFMAAKKRMEDVTSFIDLTREYDMKILALIDEPFDGTVDSESAQRINDFGSHVFHNDNTVVLLATHVYPEFLIENFVGTQVQINEPEIGLFERTYKVKPGIAQWWFKDGKRRSRFIDWLSLQMKDMSL